MKFPRCIRLDPSDLNIYRLAAEPGEWAVAGGFAFAEADPGAFDNPGTFNNKDKLAFQSGWLGTESFGRAISSRPTARRTWPRRCRPRARRRTMPPASAITSCTACWRSSAT